MSKYSDDYYLTAQEISDLRTDAKVAMRLASVLTAQNVKPLRFSLVKKRIEWLNHKKCSDCYDERE